LSGNIFCWLLTSGGGDRDENTGSQLFASFFSHLAWYKSKVILVKPCKMEKNKFNAEEVSIMHDVCCHYFQLLALVSLY